MKKKIIFGVIIIVILAIVAIITYRYFNQFKIIAEFQNLIGKIEKEKNYNMQITYENGSAIEVTVKDNKYMQITDETYGIYTEGDKSYYVNFDTNTKEEITEETVKAISINQFNLTDSEITTNNTVSSIRNLLPNLKVSKTTFNDVECYKIETGETIYYVRINDYMPVGSEENGELVLYNIEVGNVTDSDVQIDF